MDTIETRVAALERSTRRWRAAAVMLGLVVIVGAGAAAQKPADADLPISPRLRTNRLDVVNKEGKVVAKIGADGNGDGTLILLSREEKQAVKVLASPLSKGVSVLGDDELQRAALLVAKGNPFVVITNRDHQDVASLSEVDGVGMMDLTYKGDSVVEIGAGKDERGVVVLKDRAGNVTWNAYDKR